MEKKQKGEQFRIIDYARLPEKPISPDIKKLFLISLALGLGLGGGLIFLLEFFNQVIRSEDQIETEIGLSILTSIPPLSQPGDTMKKGIELAGFCILTFYASAIFIFFALLNSKGIDRTLNFFKTHLNI